LQIINKFGNNYLYKDKEERKGNLSFKGVLDDGFAHNKITNAIKFMEQDAKSYFLLSLGTMGIPRCIVDFHRNFSAGLETALYEGYGMVVNYMLPGFVALGIAKSIQWVHNKRNPGNKLNLTLWTDNKTIDAFSDVWKGTSGSKERVKDYLSQIFTESTVVKGKENINLGKNINKKVLDDQINELTKLITSPNVLQKEELAKITNAIAKHAGARDIVKFSKSGTTSLDKLIEDASHLAKNYFIEEKSLKLLKTTNSVKTVGALALVVSATFSSQFINRWITYKRTGKKDFVGYSDFEKTENKIKDNDKNEKNKSLKPSFSGASDILQNLIFKSQFPHREQIKYLIAPASASGAVAASRDDNEQREKLLKAGFTLANFFFLPDLIEKLVCYPLRKTDKNKELKNQIINYPVEGAGFFKSKIKSHSEIYDYCWNKAQQVLGGNAKDEVVQAKIEELGLLKKLQALKNKSKLSAYLYTFATIGAGIPIINTIMTEKRHKKQLDKQYNVSSGESLKSIAQNKELKELFSDFIKSPS